MNKPTKAELNKLIKAYSIQRAAKRQNAAMKDQQRTYDRFDKLLTEFFHRHSEYLGKFPSQEFMDGLDKAADRYDKTRIVSGAGVDW